MNKLIRILLKPVPTPLVITSGFLLFVLLVTAGAVLEDEAPHRPPPVHIQWLTVTEDGKTVTVPLMLPTNIDFKLQ